MFDRPDIPRVRVALSGEFELPHYRLAKAINTSLGEYHSQISETTTHLVASPENIANDCMKFKQVRNLGENKTFSFVPVKIVSYDWLARSVSDGQIHNETAFPVVMSTSILQKACVNMRAKGKKKRKRREWEDGNGVSYENDDSPEQRFLADDDGKLGDLRCRVEHKHGDFGYIRLDEKRWEKQSAVQSDIKRTSITMAPPSHLKRITSELQNPIHRLMALIFDQQTFDDTIRILKYDAKKRPLADLSTQDMEQAHRILREIELGRVYESCVSFEKRPYSDVAHRLSTEYDKLIPQYRQRFDCSNILEQVSLLDDLCYLKATHKTMQDATNLEDMVFEDERMDGGVSIGDPREAQDTLNLYDRQLAALKLSELTALDAKSNEFQVLEEYLRKTHFPKHYLFFSKVQDIYRVKRNEGGPSDNLAGSDHRLLWHSTQVAKIPGILSQGFHIMPDDGPSDTYPVGKGPVFTDCSCKAVTLAPYECTDNIAVMLLCEVPLKTQESGPMLVQSFSREGYEMTEKVKKRNCIAGLVKGRFDPKWKDAGCLNEDLAGVMMPATSQPLTKRDTNNWRQFNEYTAYDITHIKPRYIICVHIENKPATLIDNELAELAEVLTPAQLAAREARRASRRKGTAGAEEEAKANALSEYDGGMTDESWLLEARRRGIITPLKPNRV